jgi:hypothetical protein
MKIEHAMVIILILLAPLWAYASDDEGDHHEGINGYPAESMEFGAYTQSNEWKWTEEQINASVSRPIYYLIQFDVNYDASIDLEEFNQAKVDRTELKGFSQYDSDHNGRIDVGEFRSINR